MCFKDGRESVDPCSGRPSTSRTSENVEEVWNVHVSETNIGKIDRWSGNLIVTVSQIFDEGCKYEIWKVISVLGLLY